MPRKPKATPAELPAIPADLLEQFGNGPMTADAINATTLALRDGFKKSPRAVNFFSILLILAVMTGGPRRWVSQSLMTNFGH